MSSPGSPPPARPGLPWRLSSMAITGITTAICRTFLYGLNRVEIVGLDNLLGTLDRRRIHGRERGLLTVCNHVSVLDDPVMWGILPLRYSMDLHNVRWGLGAHDICFKNKYVVIASSAIALLTPTGPSPHSSASARSSLPTASGTLPSAGPTSPP
jgi:monolysocardiolipin acyltransferase